MDIVVLNDFAYLDGGASKIALGSARALASRGHRVHLFTAVGPVAPELRDVFGLTVHCLGQHEVLKDPQRLRAVTSGLWNHAAAAGLGSMLRTLDPRFTVVHLHTWTKALSASVVRTSLRLGFRVVLTLHDYFSACPTGSFFIHPTQQICTLRPLSPACIGTQCDSRSYSHKLWRVGRQWIGKHAGRLPKGLSDFITISHLSEEVLKPELPASARLHRVPNFIDLEQEPPARPAGSRRYCFAGRLSPEKGPRLLAESVRGLALDLVFIGDGPQHAELAALLPEATFTGWLDPARTRQAMRECRALIFPSRWYETQGLVVSEAAALGLPAVVPSTSAAREWVQDGVTGLIFQGGDATDLRRKLLFLDEHPEAVSALGRQAYENYWREPATSTRHCERLEEVYRGMLGEAQRCSLRTI